MGNYKTFAVDLALQAGEIIRQNFTLGMKKEWKVNNTPLTVTDTKINRLVINAVKNNFPSHDILGEEESNMGDSEFVWVCDPLDGTIPFSHGIPTCAFSLALTQNGYPILGIVYDPFMKRLIVAQKGKGVYLNNKKISVSSKSDWQNSIMSFDGLNSPLIHNAGLQIAKLTKKGTKILILCSCVYAGMLVASGELIAVVYAHQNPWDVAALKIIIEEAGGVCTDIAGGDQLYNKQINGFIGSNGKIHKELVKMIND